MLANDNSPGKGQDSKTLSGHAALKALDVLPFAVVITDPAGVVIYGNGAALERFGAGSLRTSAADSIAAQPHTASQIAIDGVSCSLMAFSPLKPATAEFAATGKNRNPILGKIFGRGSVTHDKTLAGLENLLSTHAEQGESGTISLFKDFFELALVGTAIALPDKKWVYANRRFCSMLGYTRDELSAMTWDAITHPDDSAEDAQYFQRALDGTAESYCIDKRFVTKSRETMHAMMSVVCVRGRDRKPAYFIAQIQDMGDRKKAEERLRRNEKRLRILFDESPLAKAIFGRDGRLIMWNRKYAALLGCDDSELSGTPFFRFTSNEYLKKEIPFFSRLANGEIDSYKFEKQCYRKNGEPIWVSANMGKLPAADDGYALIGVFEDITDRKATERALLDSERRLSLALDAAADGFWEMVLPSGHAMFSENLSRLLGYAPGTFASSMEALFALIHPDDAQRVRDSFERHLHRESSVFNEEFRIHTADGRFIWARCKGKTAETDAAGNPAIVAGTLSDITAEKKHAEQLLQTQERLSMTQKIARLGGWELDLRSLMMTLSPGLCETLGIKAPNGKVMPLVEFTLRFIRPQDRNMMAKQATMALEKGAEQNYSSYFHCEATNTAGENIHLSLWCERKTGHILTGVAQDVTLMHSSEQTAASVEDTLLFILNSAPDMAMVLDGKYAIEHGNKRLADYLGSTPEKVKGMNVFAALPLPLADALRAGLEEANASAGAVSREIRLAEQNYLARIYLLPSSVREKGKAVIFLLDISGRKTADASLRAVNEKLAAVLDGMPYGVCAADRESGEVLFANRYIRDRWGDEALSGIASLSRKIGLPDGMLDSAGQNGAFDFRTADTSLWMRCESRSVEMPEHPAVSLLAFYDINAPRQEQEELSRLLKAERDINDLKTRFIASASHEFRSPMTVISAAASLLRKHGRDMSQEKMEELLSRITSNINRILTTLDETLMISRLESGKAMPRIARADLLNLTSGLMEEAKLTDAGSHTMEISSEGSDFLAETDPGMLSAALHSLMENALKYSAPDSTVRVHVRDVGDSVAISVADQGIGIPAEEQGRIGESFFRASNVGGAKGTGLGLSIARRTAELCGGRLSFESTQGKGSTFTLTIPKEPPANA